MNERKRRRKNGDSLKYSEKEFHQYIANVFEFGAIEIYSMPKQSGAQMNSHGQKNFLNEILKFEHFISE